MNKNFLSIFVIMYIMLRLHINRNFNVNHLIIIHIHEKNLSKCACDRTFFYTL